MSDRIEDVAVVLLVVAVSVAAISLAVWLWIGDDPLGINGLFKGE